MLNDDTKQGQGKNMKYADVAEYLDRNCIWIRPLVACLILGVLPFVLAQVGPELGIEVDKLVPISRIGIALGLLVLGYGLIVCRTASARVVLSGLIALTFILLVQFGLYSWQQNYEAILKGSQTHE